MMLQRIIPFFLCWLSTWHVVQGQENTEPRIIDPEITAVKMEGSSGWIVCNLNGGNIRLSFDHLGDELKNYAYTIVHCDSDWQPSELQDNEYIDGFVDDRITDINVSQSTLRDYTSYALALPNRNMRFTRSGNYLLKIMDDDNDRELVLLRRFMVTENAWPVHPVMVPVSNASKLFSHQEIDFSVVHERFNINNPDREVKAFICQNMRWDRILGPIAPRPFVQKAQRMSYDYQDSIVFPAGKEWRFFDIRSLDFRGAGVRSQYRDNNGWVAVLKPEQDRYESTGYGLVDDIDGQYHIENRTPSQDASQTEYVQVQFVLELNAPYDDKDVYVFGELTDWQFKPEFKMEYDEPSHTYYCTPLLKQGYYNYAFVVVDHDTLLPSREDDLEGNWHETGNTYTILTYYRPFGANYDRLMGVGRVNSKIK